MTNTSEQQGPAARSGRRTSARVRAFVAVPLVSLLTVLSLTAVTGAASAAPASAPSQPGAAPHAVLPVGAVEAGTGVMPDINQETCYVGDSFWDMKISGKWYCWASNGSVDVYPNVYVTSKIYTHNNSGTIWYYSQLGGITSDNLAHWTEYNFEGYELQLTGFTITGR